jgi:hypothetical protein
VRHGASATVLLVPKIAVPAWYVAGMIGSILLLLARFCQSAVPLLRPEPGKAEHNGYSTYALDQL